MPEEIADEALVEQVESAPTEVEQATEVQATEVQATEVQATEVQDSIETEEVKEQTKTVPYSRFNTVYYQKKAAERELAELKAKQAQALPVTSDNEPTLEQFDYDSERHTSALIDYRLQQREVQQQQQAQQAKQSKVINQFKAKQEEYQLKNGGYFDLANQADYAGIQFSDALSEAIMTSDVGVKVHEHLLRNPQKIDEFNSKTPLQAMREFVRLEDLFINKKPKAISKAPDPISPVHGSSSSNRTGSELGKMSPADYYKHRMGQ